MTTAIHSPKPTTAADKTMLFILMMVLIVLP